MSFRGFMSGNKTEHDQEKIDALMDLLGKQYDNKEKTGLGYEAYFVWCVRYRMNKVLTEWEENPDRYQEYGEALKVDRSLAILLVMLHDVGLTVSCEGHNDIGFGVVKGSLSVADVLKTPVFSSRLKDGFLWPQEKDHLASVADGREKCSDLTEEERIGLSVILARCMRFFLGYRGSVPGGGNLEDAKADQVFSAFAEFFPNIDDHAIVRDAVDSLFKDGKLVVSGNSTDLQVITKELQDVLTNEEIEVFAEAVQDHVFFRDEDGNSYSYRNIYGKLLAEAIKLEMEFAQLALSELNKTASRQKALYDKTE